MDGELDRAIHQAIELQDASLDWPRSFAEAARDLERVGQGRFIAIEHVGSTAVSGLAAKPIIDILLGVAGMADADAAIPALCAAGWLYPVDHNRALQDRRWLMRQSGGRRTHHLHVMPCGAPAWLRMLAFRDLLRADAGVAAAYVALKRDLARRFGSDREAYTAAKSRFIEQNLAQP